MANKTKLVKVNFRRSEDRITYEAVKGMITFVVAKIKRVMQTEGLDIEDATDLVVDGFYNNFLKDIK